ncbi:MAG: ParA family protein [Verrucomicrobiota bacterium]
MMTIAFINGKGGVGKSTLCFLVGLALLDAGRAVAVEDLDPQQSITAWIKPERDGLNVSNAPDCVLIDTPPILDHESVKAATERASHIVLPCSPSPGDVTAINGPATIVSEFMKPEANAMIVLNRYKARTILAEDATEVLNAQIGFPVLQTRIPDRQCIQRAVLGGWDALDAETQTEVFKLALEITT